MKVLKCFAWIRTGKCSKGAECGFAHQESQPPADTRTATKKRNRDADSGGADAKIVRKEPKMGDGYAKKVPKATRLDPGPQKEAKAPRTSICWHWKAEGKCPYGDDCRFSHDTEPDRKKAVAPARTGQDKKRLVF